MIEPLESDGDAAPVTVREARRRFFAKSGFGADGGYDDAWAEAEFGPFLYRVPNTAARERALRIHDLHHLGTGYATDWRGEAKISAWELGSGWGRHPYAWIIALFGFVTGLLAQPRATFVAFVRGRRSQNLYAHEEIDTFLDEPLSTLKRELHVPDAGAASHASMGDVVRFASTAAVSVVFGVLAMPFVASLVVIGETHRASLGVRCPFGAPA